MHIQTFLLLAVGTVIEAAVLVERQAPTVTVTVTGSASSVVSPTVAQYFQTSPELFAGPTATGRAPFLAQSNPVFFASSVSFYPNPPLETSESISGQGTNASIFQLMGNLSPYFPNPIGFGVSEYPLPAGANITQVQVSGVVFVFQNNTDFGRCSLVTGQDIQPQAALSQHWEQRSQMRQENSMLLGPCHF
jgi:hypothetical protein